MEKSDFLQQVWYVIPGGILLIPLLGFYYLIHDTSPSLFPRDLSIGIGDATLLIVLAYILGYLFHNFIRAINYKDDMIYGLGKQVYYSIIKKIKRKRLKESDILKFKSTAIVGNVLYGANRNKTLSDFIRRRWFFYQSHRTFRWALFFGSMLLPLILVIAHFKSMISGLTSKILAILIIGYVIFYIIFYKLSQFVFLDAKEHELIFRQINKEEDKKIKEAVNQVITDINHKGVIK